MAISNDVPAAGRAQAGLAAHDGGECAVAGEMRGDGLGVGVEVEDAAEARCDDGQRRDVIAGDLDLKRIARGRVADGDESDVIVDTRRCGDRCRRGPLQRRGWRVE